LHADGVEAGDHLEPGFQFADHLQVTRRLIERREGVDVGELRPGDRDHLAAGIELHGAGTERDHRVVERQIPVLQFFQVAQHLVLGVVGVEHRMPEDGVVTQQGRRQTRVVLLQLRVEFSEVGVDAGEQFDQVADVGPRSLLIDGDGEYARGDLAEVVACVERGLVGAEGVSPQLDAQGVEEVSGFNGHPCPAQALGEQGGQAVDAPGDPAQTLRAVVDGVHAGHVGEQNLRGTDVRVCLFATDVLFAGLQRHAQRGLAAGVYRDPDDAASHRPLVFVPAGKEGRVRAAETERDAEALRRSEGDVGAHLSRRAQQHQRHQVRGDGDDAAARFDGGDGPAEVADFTEVVGILEQRTEDLLLRRLVG
jgi:hypothetical protein